MRWLVAITGVRAGAGRVKPEGVFAVETDAVGDELVALGAARDAEDGEIPADADEGEGEGAAEKPAAKA